MTARRGREEHRGLLDGALSVLVVVPTGLAVLLIILLAGPPRHLKGWVVLLSLSAVARLSYIARRSLGKHRVEVERLRIAHAPCKHGVQGGALNPLLCPACVGERKAAEARARALAEEKRRRQEEEAQRRFAEWRARMRTPEYLKSMNPEEFEHVVRMLYRQLGYDVEETPYVGDDGVDGYLRKDGRTILLQCKRTHGSVGQPVLQQLRGAMADKHADGGIVVTTGTVSSKALAFATRHQIEILRLAELQRLISETLMESEIVPAGFAVEVEPTDICPRCGRALRSIKGRHGKFLGCTGYPACRYTRRGRRRR